jgi:hypothetical protein
MRKLLVGKSLALAAVLVLVAGVGWAAVPQGNLSVVGDDEAAAIQGGDNTMCYAIALFTCGQPAWGGDPDPDCEVIYGYRNLYPDPYGYYLTNGVYCHRISDPTVVCTYDLVYFTPVQCVVSKPQ